MIQCKCQAAVLLGCSWVFASGCAVTDLTYRVSEAPEGFIGELWCFRGHEDAVQALCFSPDGQLLATAGDRTSRVLDVETGRQVSHFAGHGNLCWHARYLWAPIAAIPFLLSPGCAMFCGMAFIEEGYINTVDFAPNGRDVVTGGHHGTIRVWDARTGWQHQASDDFEEEVTEVAFSPSGDRVAATTYGGTLVLWDVRTSSDLWRRSPSGHGLSHPCFTPGGERVICRGSDDGIWVLDAATGQVVEDFTLRGRVTGLRVSRDGKRLLPGLERSITAYNLATGAPIREYAGLGRALGWLNHTAWSDDETRAVVVESDGWKPDVLLVADLERDEVTCKIGEHDDVRSLALSPDGRLAATGGDDGTVRLWRLSGIGSRSWYNS